MTLAALIVPEPSVTVQVWPAGWVETVTLYGAPSVKALLKVKSPSAVLVRSSELLFCSTRVPESPLTEPPTV